MIQKSGSYFLDVYEEQVGNLKASNILTNQKAIYLRATSSFKDVYGIDRKNGEEWLVTIANAETHIIDVNEELVKQVDLIVLSSRQYCVVLNPVDKNGKNQWGIKEL